MMRQALVVFTAFGLMSASAGAGELSFPKPQVEQWQLENGMRVFYLGVHRTPVVTVQVWYHAGSKDEPRDRRGSAHMFEHLMFKGTQHVPPEEHARLLDKLGGSVNAFTMEDTTGYHDTVPRQYLDFAIQLEAERMQHLVFLDKTIATEREVVKEEIRQRENNPISKAFVRFRELAFVRHPYAWDPGGRIADLDNTTPEDLERFYRTYYQPNNAALVVVGDVSRAEVEKSAVQWFGSIPKAPAPPRPADALPEPEQTEQRKEIVEAGQLGVIIGGYKMPPAKHDDLPALEVTAAVLSRGDSSRLHQRIVRKEKVGVFAGVFLEAMEHPGLMLVFGAHLLPEQAAKVEAAILDEMAKLQKSKVGPRELTRVKNQLAAEFVYKLQNVTGLAWQIGQSWILTGDPAAWLDDYDRLMAVSAGDVQRVARTYLKPGRLTLVAVPPGGKAGGAGGGQ